MNIPCRDEQMDDYVQTVFHSLPSRAGGDAPHRPLRERVPNWIREVEGMVRMGNSGSTAFHPQIAGTPGGRWYFAASASIWPPTGMWCAPCIEIANYYKAVMEGNDDAH